VTTPTGPRYAGLVTRAVALMLDAILITGIEFLVGLGIGLTVSVLVPGASLPTLPKALLAGVGWLVFVGAYLVGFWTLTGRTPGMRVMGLSIETVDGKPLAVRRSARRLAGLVLSFMSFGILFLPILFTERRRGFHDRLGRTVVVYNERLEHEPLPPVAPEQAADGRATSVAGTPEPGVAGAQEPAVAGAPKPLVATAPEALANAPQPGVAATPQPRVAPADQRQEPRPASG
jgi:uncharacterized RDD family membrane protein YckC